MTRILALLASVVSLTLGSSASSAAPSAWFVSPDDCSVNLSFLELEAPISLFTVSFHFDSKQLLLVEPSGEQLPSRTSLVLGLIDDAAWFDASQEPAQSIAITGSAPELLPADHPREVAVSAPELGEVWSQLWSGQSPNVTVYWTKQPPLHFTLPPTGFSEQVSEARDCASVQDIAAGSE